MSQTMEIVKSSSLTESLSGSTIYNRNEARRIKTMQNIDDSRPAAIRVLSGLPGFRNFIQPYQPESASGSSTMANSDGSFNYSDQTVFSTNAVAADASKANERALSTVSTQIPSSAMAMGLAGSSLAMMLRNTKSRSPIFAMRPTTPSAVPMFTSTNSAAVAFLKPACPHSRVLMSGPAAQSMLIVSFLAFVGYRNVQYYYGDNSRTRCSED